MSKQKIREWLDNNSSLVDQITKIETRWFHEESWDTTVVDKRGVVELIHQYTQDQSGWVSVDFVRLNVDLVVPKAQYEGPDYYKGYHQAREDILSTLPPTEEA